MTPQDWDKIKEIFLEAIEIDSPDERAKFLTENCGRDEKLKREVEKLIAQDEESESLMNRPAMEESGVYNLASSIEKDPMLNRQIGVFRIEKEIGRGGMGAVYLANRADGSFRQQVAIKLIKRGMDTDFILRRFRQERQILATLSHPYIARLLDGGTTDDGLPYFVMEFVEGKPLYKYSDQKKLSITERLKLFRQICRAIDFAHQNQVIHRDIKPPNILVTRDGMPKLLDFGIAKVLNPELGFDTIDPTATSMRLMTPEYASPEQVCGGKITPASDIYSLGVLLYELLTGHRPYRFQNRASHEIARVICEQEPERPSSGVTREDSLLPTGASEATTLVDVYVLRGAANFEDLQKELTGDIEKIILKALRKEPGERYKSAAEFADDITRYLDGKPVAAEIRFPPIVQVMRPSATGEKSLAVLPLKVLNLSPNADTGEEFLSVGLADAMITRLSGIQQLAVRPTSAILRYTGDGVNPLQAGRELAVDLVLDGRLRVAGARIRVSLQLLDVKASTSIWASQFDEKFTDALELEDLISEKVSEALLPKLTTGGAGQQIKKRGTEKPEAFDAYLRGRFFWNKFTPEFLPMALESFRRAIELDPNYALAYASLADFYNWAGIYGIIEPEESYTQAKATALRALEIDDSLAEAISAYALAITGADWNYVEAERLYLQAIELNPNYSLACEWYAALLVGTGRFDEGVEMIRRAESLNPLALRAMTLTAWTLYQAGLFSEAIAKAEQIVQLDKNFPQGYLQLGNALMHVGRIDEALAAVRQADLMMPNTALTKYLLCFALVAANRRDEARSVLSELENLAAAVYVKPYFLAIAYVALGKREKAFEFFEKALDEHDQWLNWLGTEAKLESVREDEFFIELFRRTKNPLAEKLPGESQPHTGSEKSIAVLPLKLIGASVSEDTGDNYLCVGLADALITRLSNVHRFIVRPTSSVLPYGENKIDAFAAGKKLAVDFVVDGNIRRVGSRIRVTAQLLSVADRSTRWAQTFDEDFVDVLALEDSISEKVAKSLVPHLTGTEEQQLKKRGTDNREAFEVYLRGRHYWNTFTEEGFAKALIFYNRAIAVAPDYALAYAGIADYYNLLGVYAIMPFQETSAAAKEAAQKAVELDDSLAEGHAALGFAVLMHDFDWAQTEKHLRRAIELNPNYVTGRIWYSSFLCVTGDWDGALIQVRRALELDSLTPFVSHTLNLTLYYARRFDEAIAAAEKFIEREPRYGLAPLFLSSALWRVGRTEEALKFVNRAIALLGRTPYSLVWLASAHAASGDTEKARQIIAEIEELSTRRYTSPYLLAIAYANLRDTEKTLELLEKAWEIRDGRLTWLGVEPQFDRMRSNPRFEKILRETGNPIFAKLEAGKNKSDQKSLAVLPFKVIGAKTSEDTGDEYLGIGLADTLITRLSKVNRLIVRPTSSVLSFQNSQADSVAVGRELAVDFVVDGTIRRAGKQIRVTAQLLDVESGATDWAEQYDNDFTNVLALEDSISKQVIEAVVPQLTGEEQKKLQRRATENPQAFESYLRGRYHFSSYTEDGFAKAIEAYEEAVRLDVNYALAFAGISDYYNWLGVYGILPSAEAFGLAKENALRAINLDAELSEAHAALGFAAVAGEYDFEDGEKSCLRALELNPNNATAHVWYSLQLFMEARFEEGERHARRSIELDPLAPFNSYNLGWCLYYAEKFDESIDAFRKTIGNHPLYAIAHLGLSWTLRRVGRHSEAVAAARRAVELSNQLPFWRASLAQTLAAAGGRDEAKEILSELLAEARENFISPYHLGLIYYFLGEREKTLEYLEKSLKMREAWMVWSAVEPIFEDFRADDRFQKLLRAMNHPLALK